MADRTLVMGLCRYEFSWHKHWFVRFVERTVRHLVSEDVFVGTEIPEWREWGVGWDLYLTLHCHRKNDFAFIVVVALFVFVYFVLFLFSK